MTRWLAALLAVAALAACGKYGPPQRAAEPTAPTTEEEKEERP